MAGTFYGYAERNADSYVDWREVGQYATDMIDETVKVRQEKKDALDAATRDALKFVANAPVGADTSVRKKALQMSDIVSKNLLIQEKLMKSGKLDPKDYLIYNQNALDTIDLSFNAMKAYQDEYQSTMDGINNKELSVLTAENIGFAETYGNLDTLGFTMSPDGKIMMGKEVEKEIDGKKVKSLENITSVNALNGLILSKIKHNKIEDQVNAYVQALGVDKRAKIRNATFDRQGQVITIEDIRQRKNEDPDAFQFREAELEQARSMIGDPSNIASILIDTKKVASNGKAYEVTNDENEAKRDPSKILRVFTPNKGYNFVVSKEQEQDAIDFTLNRMRERYKYEEKVDVGSQAQKQTSEWEYRAGKETEKEQAFVTNLAQNMIYSMTGGLDKANPSTQYLSEITGINLHKTPTGYEVVNKEGKSQFYEFAPDGKLADPIGFGRALAGVIKKNLPDKYGNVSEDQIVKELQRLLPKGATLNQSTDVVGFKPKPKKQTAVEQFSSYIDNAMSQKFDKKATANEILSSLNEKLEGTRFRAKESLLGYIYIIRENEKGIKVAESPAFKVKDINGGLARLSKWMKSNLPTKKIGDVEDKEAAAQELIDSKVLKSGGTIQGGNER